MARANTRAREAELGFEALSIEGGLLSPEWLAKVAQLQAGAQSEADYGIPKGLALRDEIGRYWRIAQAHWAEYRGGLASKADRTAVAEWFIVGLLKQAFGFDGLVAVSPVLVNDRPFPIGHATLEGRVPVVVAPAGEGVDVLSPAYGDGTRRRSAFGLVQEYLNAQEGALWGLCCDGTTLRILRDNASLTRPAWLEADLGRIFIEERYADFAALWLLIHQTRFGRAGQPASDCALEVWRAAGREEGTRAREHLRDGVEDALATLGQGFLSHPGNQALRAALQGGDLSAKDYFNQLLRLVYRLIFLLTVEERGLLHPEGTPESARELYATGYSLRRLRERSVKRSAHDRFSDLWEATKVAFRGLATGEATLGLPALAGLFARGQCPALDASRLENRTLLLAMYRLSWLREDGSLARVNWRDMGPEELGSVYESLLELVPQIGEQARKFLFAQGAETKGNARKTTGSYYTPDSLVQVLLDSALEPLVADTMARHLENPAEALLHLAVVDPACGSGHFLLAAARRLAAHVARLQANGTPSAAQYRHALRQVVGRCIFGVDLNPMAVELCKVGLWMEAVEPGLPLTFLNSHIQQGNALLGATPELMAGGIPDAAWKSIESDDPAVAPALRRRNKAERGGQRTLSLDDAEDRQPNANILATAVTALDDLSDARLADLTSKERCWVNVLDSPEYRLQKLLADAWCAAFMWPKQSSESADWAPTNERWRQLRDSQALPPERLGRTVETLARDYAFFHWHLQFPQVLARGGFDLVIGNPPWERLKIETEEWMTNAGIDLDGASNAAERNRLLGEVIATDPKIAKRWQQSRRHADALDHFVRQSGRYQRTAAGDINSYALFAELGSALLRDVGYGAWVLPLGIVTDKTYAALGSQLLSERRLRSVYGFVNERQLFADVLHNFKFVTLSIGPAGSNPKAVFIFGLLDPIELSTAVTDRAYRLDAEDVAALNPDTLTCPVFLDANVARVLTDVHRRLPRIGTSDWKIKPQAMLHMGTASKHFRAAPQDPTWLPVYESKMVHRYNHRFGSFAELGEGQRSHMLPRSSPAQLQSPEYEVTPGYFCASEVIPDMGLRDVEWWLVFRRIANPALARTSAFCVIPRVAVSDSLSVLVPLTPRSTAEWAIDAALICWIGNSIVFDAMLKQKMGGPNFSEYVWNQLPVPSRSSLKEHTPWSEAVSWINFVVPRVCELTVTSRSTAPFARDLGRGKRVYPWDEARRSHIEAELDAAAAVAYGLNREDFAALFEVFAVLKERESGSGAPFVTRDRALAAYDEFQAASSILGVRSETPATAGAM